MKFMYILYFLYLTIKVIVSKKFGISYLRYLEEQENNTSNTIITLTDEERKEIFLAKSKSLNLTNINFSKFDQTLFSKQLCNGNGFFANSTKECKCDIGYFDVDCSFEGKVIWKKGWTAIQVIFSIIYAILFIFIVINFYSDIKEENVGFLQILIRLWHCPKYVIIINLIIATSTRFLFLIIDPFRQYKLVSRVYDRVIHELFYSSLFSFFIILLLVWFGLFTAFNIDNERQIEHNKLKETIEKTITKSWINKIGEWTSSIKDAISDPINTFKKAIQKPSCLRHYNKFKNAVNYVLLIIYPCQIVISIIRSRRSFQYDSKAHIIYYLIGSFVLLLIFLFLYYIIMLKYKLTEKYKKAEIITELTYNKNGKNNKNKAYLINENDIFEFRKEIKNNKLLGNIIKLLIGKNNKSNENRKNSLTMNSNAKDNEISCNLSEVDFENEKINLDFKIKYFSDKENVNLDNFSKTNVDSLSNNEKTINKKKTKINLKKGKSAMIAEFSNDTSEMSLNKKFTKKFKKKKTYINKQTLDKNNLDLLIQKIEINNDDNNSIINKIVQEDDKTKLDNIKEIKKEENTGNEINNNENNHKVNSNENTLLIADKDVLDILKFNQFDLNQTSAPVVTLNGTNDFCIETDSNNIQNNKLSKRKSSKLINSNINIFKNDDQENRIKNNSFNDKPSSINFEKFELIQSKEIKEKPNLISILANNEDNILNDFRTGNFKEDNNCDVSRLKKKKNKTEVFKMKRLTEKYDIDDNILVKENDKDIINDNLIDVETNKLKNDINNPDKLLICSNEQEKIKEIEELDLVDLEEWKEDNNIFKESDMQILNTIFYLSFLVLFIIVIVVAFAITLETTTVLSSVAGTITIIVISLITEIISVISVLYLFVSELSYKEYDNLKIIGEIENYLKEDKLKRSMIVFKNVKKEKEIFERLTSFLNIKDIY
jgi:hypothetical protein